LRTGDLVAVVATSGGLEKDEAPLYERGVDVLEQMGLAVRVSPSVDPNRSWWWSGNGPSGRAPARRGLLI
jgi:muramoyltetrapeptide carboxypeptidase LdcA involved in peptidoglycan recycling